MLVFQEREKPEYSEKNPPSRVENQQQTQPTYDAGSGNRTRDTLKVGEAYFRQGRGHAFINSPPSPPSSHHLCE